MKKGQITIFILIAILIVVGVSSVFIVRDSFTLTKIPKGAEPVYNAILSCLEEVGGVSTIIVLAQGGTYEKGNSDIFQVYKLAKPISKEDDLKAIKRNKKYDFSKENIENSVEVFFNEFFGICMDSIDFSSFEEEVILGEFNLNANVEDKFIIMNLDFPVIINQGNSSIYISKFTHREKVNIKVMENVVNQIVDESVELNFPPYDLMDTLENKYNLDIEKEFVFEELAIENIIYSIKFKDENRVVALDINYDWYNYNTTNEK